MKIRRPRSPIAEVEPDSSVDDSTPRRPPSRHDVVNPVSVRTTRVRSAACGSKTSARSSRSATIGPVTVMPYNVVRKEHGDDRSRGVDGVAPCVLVFCIEESTVRIPGCAGTAAGAGRWRVGRSVDQTDRGSLVATGPDRLSPVTWGSWLLRFELRSRVIACGRRGKVAGSKSCWSNDDRAEPERSGPPLLDGDVAGLPIARAARRWRDGRDPDRRVRWGTTCVEVGVGFRRTNP